MLLFPEEGWARSASSSYWTLQPSWWSRTRCKVVEVAGTRRYVIYEEYIFVWLVSTFWVFLIMRARKGRIWYLAKHSFVYEYAILSKICSFCIINFCYETLLQFYVCVGRSRGETLTTVNVWKSVLSAVVRFSWTKR